MVRLSGFSPGVDMDIRYTGLRPGEKLFEELFASGEERRSQVHVKVFEAVQDPHEPARLEQGLRDLLALTASAEPGRQRELLDCFMGLVPSYRPSPGGLGRFLAQVPGTTPVSGLGAIA